MTGQQRQHQHQDKQEREPGRQAVIHQQHAQREADEERAHPEPRSEHGFNPSSRRNAVPGWQSRAGPHAGIPDQNRASTAP